MATVQIFPDSKTSSGQPLFTSFLVALTSVQAVSSSGSDTLTSTQFPIPVVLDSGTTLSYLPTDIAIQVWNEVGAVYSNDIGLAVVPCSLADNGGVFNFGFGGPGGPQISVGMDELVLDLTNGQAPTFTSGPYKGQTACEFGIQNLSSNPFLLGDTFLRSAYVVYDLVNNQVGMAPTDFNATSSNVVAFASSGASIPSSTPAPNQDQVTSSKPSVTSPSFSASSGFTGGSQAKNAASLLPALDWSKMVVMGSAFAFMILGGGVFVL